MKIKGFEKVYASFNPFVGLDPLLLGFEDDEEGAGFADDTEEDGLAGFDLREGF